MHERDPTKKTLGVTTTKNKYDGFTIYKLKGILVHESTDKEMIAINAHALNTLAIDCLCFVEHGDALSFCAFVIVQLSKKFQLCFMFGNCCMRDFDFHYFQLIILFLIPSLLLFILLLLLFFSLKNIPLILLKNMKMIMIFTAMRKKQLI